MAVSDGETPVRMRASNSGSLARASRPSPRSASRVMAPSASPVSRIQCGDGCAAQRLERLRVFDEDGARAGGLDGAHQVRGRIARVHGGGDGAVGEDAEIGQVELQAGFGVEGDDVAFADAERAQTGGDLLGGSPVLVPGIDRVGAVGRGLAEGGGVAVDARGFFENLIQGAGSHFLQFITLAEMRGAFREPERISGKPRRKFIHVEGEATRGQTGLAANFRQRAPEIHVSLVSPGLYADHRAGGLADDGVGVGAQAAEIAGGAAAADDDGAGADARGGGTDDARGFAGFEQEIRLGADFALQAEQFFFGDLANSGAPTEVGFVERLGVGGDGVDQREVSVELPLQPGGPGQRAGALRAEVDGAKNLAEGAATGRASSMWTPVHTGQSAS